jgi:hypothetical protein
MEVSAGQTFSDEDFRMSYESDSMTQGIAAVVESAGSVTVDAIWKP